MGVYTYTLRKTGSFEVLGLGRVYLLKYLCRANDLDEPWYDDSGYRGRLRGRLTAAVNRAKDAFSGPVLFVYDGGDVGPDRGAEVFHTDDADKVSVWDDCNILAGQSMGRLSQRVRCDGRLVWTLMSKDEQAAWEAEQTRLEAQRMEEGRRRYQEMEQQRKQERLEREAQRQRDDSFNSAGL